MPESSGRIASGKVRLAQILLLGALGVSCYLLYFSVKGGGVAGCGPESGCSEVLNSRWSKAGVIPVSALAATVYIFTLFWSAQLLNGSQKAQKYVTAATCTILASALWFAALQFFVIHAICVFCMTAHAAGALASVLLLMAVGAQPGKVDLMPAITGGTSASLLLILLQVAIQPKTNIVLQYVATGQKGALSNSPAPVIATGATSAPSTNESKQLVNTPPVASAPLQPLAKTESTPPPVSPSVFPIIGGQYSLNLAELPSVGPVDAPHKLVALFDYTCKHCRHTHALLHEAMQQVTNVQLITLPVPLDSNCNRLMKRTPPPHTNACIYARTALAVWRAAPALFPKYDAWAFQGELPPPLDQIRQYAVELIGADKFAAAWQDPWISDRIARDVDIYDANSRVAKNGSLPQLIFKDGTSVGGLRDLKSVSETFREFFQMTNSVAQPGAGG